MTLPPNVLRPTPAHWESSWGDRAVPAGFGGRSVEIGRTFELRRLGACLNELPPGLSSCPMHHHLFEEEVFFVLEGELTVQELRPGVPAREEYTLRPGELVVYPPGTGIAHRSWNRTSVPVRYLALSTGWLDHEITVYPDSGKTQLRALRQLGQLGPDGPSPVREVQRLSARPSWVASSLSVEERPLGGGSFGRRLAAAAGATHIFANLDRLAPGAVSGPLHWHSADEELALVLTGRPTLRQLREGSEEQVGLGPGDIVVWKHGDRIAHQLRNEGDGDATVLVAAANRPEDITVFPEEDRVYVRAMGRGGTMRPMGYFDGEG